MKTAPLFSNSSTSSKRKIHSQCQNSLNSILHNNNDKIFSKFYEMNDNKITIVMSLVIKLRERRMDNIKQRQSFYLLFSTRLFFISNNNKFII